jgi:hypothetical protein
MTFSAIGNFTTTATLGTEVFYYHVPSQPDGQGIVVRRCTAKLGATTGGSVVIDVQKGTTSLLSAPETLNTATVETLPMAGDGSEVFAPGDVLTVDITEGTLVAADAVTDVHVQIDFDRRGRGPGAS